MSGGGGGRDDEPGTKTAAVQCPLAGVSTVSSWSVYSVPATGCGN